MTNEEIVAVLDEHLIAVYVMGMVCEATGDHTPLDMIGPSALKLIELSETLVPKGSEDRGNISLRERVEEARRGA